MKCSNITSYINCINAIDYLIITIYLRQDVYRSVRHVNENDKDTENKYVFNMKCF